MIKKLQYRFIRIAVVSLTVAMVLVVGIVNIVNWISVRGELFNTLDMLMPAEPEDTARENQSADGSAPEGNTTSRPTREDKQGPGNNQEMQKPWRDRHFRNMMAESNWFSGVITENGEIHTLQMDREENLDEAAAEQLIRQAADTGKAEGFLQDYLFKVRNARGGQIVVIMNCETRLTAVRTFILISAIACAGGILLALLLVVLASRKAVEPTIRNMEQQKQFITNASHELKTPLTVISTNMELLQMESEEENPWVKSTQKQTAAMRRLVDELVYLSRMEEEHPTLEREQLDPGKLLEETAEPFVAMAEYSGREMRVTAEKDLRMTGDRTSIQRLMSTLCDNAVKYASDGPIEAGIREEGRNHILLQVSNPVAEPLTKEQCEQLFNRFYRVDSSRNKGKQSGFGIGLAIASAIAEKHGGRITAAMDGNRLRFDCLLAKEPKK